MKFSSKLGAVATAALIVGGAGAMASPLNLQDVVFTWGATAGGSNVEYLNSRISK